jgi:hypothetical protein
MRLIFLNLFCFVIYFLLTPHLRALLLYMENLSIELKSLKGQ